MRMSIKDALKRITAKPEKRGKYPRTLEHKRTMAAILTGRKGMRRRDNTAGKHGAAFIEACDAEFNLRPL